MPSGRKILPEDRVKANRRQLMQMENREIFASLHGIGQRKKRAYRRRAQPVNPDQGYDAYYDCTMDMRTVYNQTRHHLFGLGETERELQRIQTGDEQFEHQKNGGHPRVNLHHLLYQDLWGEVENVVFDDFRTVGWPWDDVRNMRSPVRDREDHYQALRRLPSDAPVSITILSELRRLESELAEQRRRLREDQQKIVRLLEEVDVKSRMTSFWSPSPCARQRHEGNSTNHEPTDALMIDIHSKTDSD
uniref:Uncharacterized protein n=1 Tax=Branchiostoma floridae TaxID=7739 RepID=C3ZUJ3_BRAFL|eukprot:XP_002587694.1 hypothetical protein BRAFLDRAFT_94597 [Branchiostoma floridae]